MARLKLELILAVVISFVSFLFGWSLRTKHPPKTDETIVEKIVYKTRLVKVPKIVTKFKTITKEKVVIKEVYVPPEGHVEIIPKDPEKDISDLIEVKRKWWGLTFKLGGFAGPVLNPNAQRKLGFAVDSKLLYVNRFGLELGVGRFQRWTPTLGLSYRLDRFKFIDNLELVGAYLPLDVVPATIGLRSNF
jgi:hypothetical protein